MKKQLFILTMSLLSVRAISQTVPAYVDTAGLSGWWAFTGNANDSSINANNGTVYGAALDTDRFGNANRAYSFDGSSNYISVPMSASLYLPSQYTYSVWVKLLDYTLNSDGSQRTVISKQRGINELGLAIRALDQSPLSLHYDCAIDNGTSSTWVPGTDTLPLSTWDNIIYTYDGSVGRIYKNGVLNDTGALSFTLSGSPEPLYFGREFDDSLHAGWFKGSIDDIGIWNRVLNECEISKLFLATNTLIVNQPVNDTVLTGGTATYAITDTGGSATYQWQENSGSGFSNLSNIAPYSGITTQTLTISPVTAAMNNYQYRCVRNGGACEDTSSGAKLIVHNSTGISSMQFQNCVTISPNPFQNSISISSSALITEVVVSNMIGQVVFSRECNDNNIDIALNSLPQGVYMIKINGSETYKIVKE